MKGGRKFCECLDKNRVIVVVINCNAVDKESVRERYAIPNVKELLDYDRLVHTSLKLLMQCL